MNPLDRLFARIPDRPLIGSVVFAFALVLAFGLGGMVGAINDAEAARLSLQLHRGTDGAQRCDVEYGLRPGERAIVQCSVAWPKRSPLPRPRAVTIESGHPDTDASLVAFGDEQAVITFAITNRSARGVKAIARVTVL